MTQLPLYAAEPTHFSKASASTLLRAPRMTTPIHALSLTPKSGKCAASLLETGREFQPVPTEGQQIIDEVGAGLVEFLLAALCAAEQAARLTDQTVALRGYDAYATEPRRQAERPVGI